MAGVMMLGFFLHEIDQIELVTTQASFKSAYSNLRHTHAQARTINHAYIHTNIVKRKVNYKRIQTLITIRMHIHSK